MPDTSVELSYKTIDEPIRCETIDEVVEVINRIIEVSRSALVALLKSRRVPHTEEDHFSDYKYTVSSEIKEGPGSCGLIPYFLVSAWKKATDYSEHPDSTITFGVSKKPDEKAIFRCYITATHGGKGRNQGSQW